KRNDQWLAELPGGVTPLIDVGIPRSPDDGVEAKFIWTATLFIRTVPRRPKDQWQRAMTPDHIQVRGRETLFTPIARGGDNGLMFADHVLEFLDHLDGDVVFGIAEIDERTHVGASLRNDDLARPV